MTSIRRQKGGAPATWSPRYRAPSGSSFIPTPGAAPGYADLWRTQRAPSVKKLVEQFRGIVYACATVNAQAVASVPCNLYVQTRKGEAAPKVATRKLSRAQEAMLKATPTGRKVFGRGEGVEVVQVMEHPLIDLLEKPSAFFDEYSLREITSIYLDTAGAAYWRVESDAFSLPMALWILQSQFVKPEKDQSNLPALWVYGSGKDAQKFSAAEIVDFRFPNLNDPYCEGWSPARAMYESINLLNQDRAHAQAQMDNQARPDVIVSPKDIMGQGEGKRLERWFKHKFKQGGTSGVAVLDQGVDVLKVELLNAYGVPPALFDSNKSRAELEAARQQHALNAVLPRLKRIDGRINQKLVPLFDPTGRLFVQSDNPVREDVDRLVVQQAHRLNVGLTVINEERLEEGREPVAWGDEPWMAAGLVQPGTRAAMDDYDAPEIDPVADEPEPAAEPAPIEGDIVVAATVLNGAQILAALDIVARVAAGELPRGSGVAMLEIMFNLSNEQAESMMGTVGAGFVSSKPAEAAPPANTPTPPPPPPSNGDDGKAADGQTKGAKPDGWTLPPKGNPIRKEYIRMVRRYRAAALKYYGLGKKNAEQAINISATPIDFSEFLYDDVKRMRPHVELYTERGGKRALSRVGASDTPWNVALPEVRDAIDAQTLNFCRSTQETTTLEIGDAVAKLRADITEGIIEGANTVSALTAIVNDVFDNAEKWRARRIATTEASRAVHDGQILAAAKSNIVVGFKFLLSPDACPICLTAAEQHGEVSLESATAQVGDYDRDLPPIHPHCMCSFTEILTEEQTDGE